MRYFNVEQHKEPKSMFSGEKLADISELEKTARCMYAYLNFKVYKQS